MPLTPLSLALGFLALVINAGTASNTTAPMLASIPPKFSTCDPSGIFRCDSSYVPYTISTSAPYQLKNCILINCPPFIFPVNTTGIIQNVTFRDSSFPNGWGGAVQVNGATVVMSNVVFSNLSAESGGAVLADLGATVIINNATFKSNTAIASSSTGGGDMLVMHGSSLTCNNCTSFGAVSNANGGSASVIIAKMTLKGGNCINSKANWGACWIIDSNAVMNVENVDVINPKAMAGPVAFLNNYSNFTAKGLRVTDSTAAGQAGCFYSYAKCITTCTGCTLTRCRSQGFGGVAVVQDRSSLYLYNSTVKDSFATDVAGAILGTGSAVVVLDGSTIQNATGSVGGAIKNEGVSTVSIVNGSKIVNCTATSAGAAYYGDSGGSIYVSRSVIANNVVLGSDGGGFYLARGEAATIDPNSSFQNNVAARYGGAVFATGGAVITITGPTIVTGNQAAQTGGALFMDSMANLTLQGPNLIINGNIAPIGSLAAFMSPPGGYLSRPKILESSGISGEIYVFYTATSVDMMNSGAFVGMSNVHLAGRAATLNIANVTSINNTSINFASTIPEFSVYAVDIFDNLVPVNYASPVIVSVSDSAVNKTSIDGETIKAILDPDTNMVRFTNLRISKPGQFTLKIGGFSSSLDMAPGATWPTINITVAVCKPDSEMLFTGTNQCVPIVNTPPSYRVGVAAAAIVAILIMCFNLIGLLKFRTLKLMRSNSIRFLILTVTGCTLSIASLVVTVAPFASSCTVSIAMDNIGFALVFGALCVKSVRIQVLFDEKRSQKAKIRIAQFVNDNVLTVYLGVGCLMMTGFLAAWDIIESPEPVAKLSATQAVTQRCNTATTFGVAVTIIRIVVILFAAFMAYQIRNVPSVYNESKILGFATYNWFLFSALLNVLVEFSIEDPAVSYVVSAIAILVPTLLTSTMLVTAKVYVCLTDPDAARMITTDGASEGSGDKPSIGGITPVGSNYSAGKGARMSKEPEPKMTAQMFGGV